MYDCTSVVIRDIYVHLRLFPEKKLNQQDQYKSLHYVHYC